MPIFASLRAGAESNIEAECECTVDAAAWPERGREGGASPRPKHNAERPRPMQRLQGLVQSQTQTSKQTHMHKTHSELTVGRRTPSLLCDTPHTRYWVLLALCVCQVPDVAVVGCARVLVVLVLVVLQARGPVVWLVRVAVFAQQKGTERMRAVVHLNVHEAGHACARAVVLVVVPLAKAFACGCDCVRPWPLTAVVAYVHARASVSVVRACVLVAVPAGQRAEIVLVVCRIEAKAAQQDQG